ncbi:methyl-accepting chemotaxis protein [Paenibacillus sp. NFR01]|uniref:methyl-accepting chemotaxis protein n=1 Tax=Paenibacillus sp. NFR01 TaxID=1566279 RepID=UPI0008B0BD77|nr:methyl-accepting chemotaxis protein [Paenibacillus sp. NFR01]SEU01239.1 methyl-accepting chemotaxis protein [Paenibacillus sp. NFR01]
MKNLKVKYKLALLIAAALIMITALGITGIRYTGKMSDRSQETYNENLEPIYLVTQIRGNNRMIESYLLENLLTMDSEKTRELDAGIQKAIADNNVLMEQLKAIPFDDSSITVNIDEYNSQLTSYRTQREAIMELAAKNENDEGYRAFSGQEFSQSRKKITAVLDDTVQLLTDMAKRQNQEAKQDADSAKLVNIIVMLAAAIVTVGISVLIARLITVPLKELQAMMKRAEEGDLTVAVTYTAKDELGVITASFNAMLGSLKRMMLGVSESAEMLSASSEEMSASAEQTARASQMIAENSSEIAVGFETQVEGIARTKHSVDVMADNIVSVNRSGEEMAVLMSKASALTDRGAEVVEQIIAQMGQIDESVAAGRETVQRLGHLSAEIDTIITTINEISSQTNLLSLNASIEAARAGEHGRGFAVVADEIRKLAEATGRSSLQITEIIRHIQTQTEQAVETMEIGSQQVAQGVAHSGFISETFGDIQQSIRETSQQTEEIRKAIAEISLESQDVATSVNQTDEIVRKGAGEVQDTSAASEEQLSAMSEMSMSAQHLATLAENLQKDIGRFKL